MEFGVGVRSWEGPRAPVRAACLAERCLPGAWPRPVLPGAATGVRRLIRLPRAQAGLSSCVPIQPQVGFQERDSFYFAI